MSLRIHICLVVGTPRDPSEGSAAPLHTLKKSLWFLLPWPLPDHNGKSTDPKTGQSVHKLSPRTYSQGHGKGSPCGGTLDQSQMEV